MHVDIVAARHRRQALKSTSVDIWKRNFIPANNFCFTFDS